METPHWYKWVILCITTISTFFAFGFISTTTSTGTIYYIDKYDERIVSTLIGPIQKGFMLASSLPVLYLSRKVGNRIQHLIGAVLLPAGLALTSLLTKSWQGLLLTGVCAGKITNTECNTDIKFDLDDEEDATNGAQQKSGEQSMMSTLKQTQSVAMMIMTFCYTGGVTSCMTVVGDYAEIKLGMTPDTVAVSLTIMGAAQIGAALIYMFLTFCTEFSATLLHSLCMFIMSACALGLCFTTSSTVFTVLLAMIGFAKAITTGNSVPLATELIGLERMMKLYALKGLLDGIGSLTVPFLAVYMQETFDSSAALYLGSAALFVSGSMFVPFYKRYIHKPTIKSSHEFVPKDDIATISYIVF